jgi:hypothetical protein
MNMRPGPIVAILSAALLTLVSGCATPGAQLTLTSLLGQRTGQSFRHAVYADNGQGEYDVVLIDDAITATPARPGQPLAATDTPSVRQIMHLHLYWRPMPGTAGNNPATINTAIDWYVITGSSEEHPDYLHYTGAGLATLYPSGDSAEVSLREAQVEPAAGRGRMNDPIGTATLRGSITARRDDAQVREVLTDLPAASHHP